MKSWLTLTFALVASSLFAQDQDRNKTDKGQDRLKAGEKGELRVYLWDKNKKPIDLKDVTVTARLSIKGGTTKDLNLELVTPKGLQTDKDKDALGMRRGEIREMEGGYLCELVVLPARDDRKTEERKDQPLPKDQPQDKTQPRDPALKEGQIAYFKAPIDFVCYGCGMEDHPISEKPGKCSVCMMEMKPVEIDFTATVIAKIKGETRKATGFKYPFAATKP